MKTWHVTQFGPYSGSKSVRNIAHTLYTTEGTPDMIGNVVVHIQANYRKDRIKTEGAYSI